jgi:ABC-type transport system involved in Fe-S cluster assembly fused permease/ATPase subunit/multidrug resistance efflux pump
MADVMTRRWTEANELYLTSQRKAADAIGGFGNLSRVLRLLLQSTVLAVGAWLVISDLATPGVMIAASILSSRALAPIELAIAHWRGFVAARQSWTRLGEVLRAIPAEEEQMSLPAPNHSLQLEGVSVTSPGGRELIVQGVSLVLQAGQGLGIIGPSASGKSSLVRAIVGLWPTVRGRIRLDGAALEHRSPLTLGPHIGYMPQGIELFDGTVAENIARFRDDADSEAVVAAAKAAGAHDMILKLGEGYNTRVGDGGAALSAGQRQRVALARALYGDPFLVVLDEPNSNLDNDGEAALTEAIKGVRARKGIVVVVAHRPSALIALDQVLVLANGSVQALGPRGEVLRKVLARQPDVVAGPGAPGPQPAQIRAAAAGGGSLEGLSPMATQQKRATLPSIRRSIRRQLLGGICVITLLGGGLGGWASTTSLAGAVIANGQITVDSNVKKVQHPTGGIVGEIRVKDGSAVKTGDLLMKLDETVTRANLAVLVTQIDELEARQARLAAERDNQKAIKFPELLTSRAKIPTVAAAMAGERSLFEARRTAIDGQKAQLTERLSQLRDEINGLEAQIASKRAQTVLIKKELGGVEQLYQKNLVPIQRLTALQREAARLEGEEGQHTSEIARPRGGSPRRSCRSSR